MSKENLPEMAGHRLSHTIRVLGSCSFRTVDLYRWMSKAKVLLLPGNFCVVKQALLGIFYSKVAFHKVCFIET